MSPYNIVINETNNEFTATASGPQGAKGDKGDPGANGAPGAPGAPGIPLSFYPTGSEPTSPSGQAWMLSNDTGLLRIIIDYVAGLVITIPDREFRIRAKKGYPIPVSTAINSPTWLAAKAANDAAWVACVTAAAAEGGWVIWDHPDPGTYYPFSATAVASSTTSQFITIGIRGFGNVGQSNAVEGSYCRWYGANSQPILVMAGIYAGVIQNWTVYNAGNASDTCFIDIRCSQLQPSTTHLTIDHCNLFFGTGGRNIGLRLGQSGPNNHYNDISYLTVRDSIIGSNITGSNGNSPQYYDTAIVNGAVNGFPFTLVNTSLAHCGIGYQGGYKGITFSGTVNPGDGSLIVNDPTVTPYPLGTNYLNPVGGIIQFVSTGEIAVYSGIVGNVITFSQRGANGTTAITMNGGTLVPFHTDTPNFALTGAPVGSSDNFINCLLGSLANFPTSGSLQLTPSNVTSPVGPDPEIVTYTGITRGPTYDTFTGVTRGRQGTTPVSLLGPYYIICEWKYGNSMGALGSSPYLVWVGGGTSANLYDIIMSVGNSVHIQGAHFETGCIHAVMGYSSTSSRIQWTETNVSMLQMAPQDGYLWYVNQTPTLRLTNVSATRNIANDWGSRRPIFFNGQVNGSMFMDQSQFQATEPPYNDQSVNASNVQTGYRLEIRRSAHVNQAGAFVSYYSNPGERQVNLTDASTVNVQASNNWQYFLLLTTGIGSNRTIAFTGTSSPGQKWTIAIQQPATGGPYPNGITWPANSRFMGTNTVAPNLTNSASAIDIFDIEVKTPPGGSLTYFITPRQGY